MSIHENDPPADDSSALEQAFQEIISDLHEAEFDQATELARVFQEATTHFFEVANMIAHGEGESVAAMSKDIVDVVNVLGQTFENYAGLVLREEPDEAVAIDKIVDMILGDEDQRVQKLNDLVPRAEDGDEHFVRSNKEIIMQKAKKSLDTADDLEEKVNIVTALYAETISADVNMLLSLAPQNKADMRIVRKELYKRRVLGVSADLLKITVGALAALAIDRKFRR